MTAEEAIRMSFGEFDCGCDNRREIMGAQDWQQDVAIIAFVAVVVVVALVVVKAK